MSRGGGEVLPVIGFLFDTLERSSSSIALLAGCSFVLVHATADDFVFLGFLGGGGSGDGTAGGSFWAGAGVVFGFEVCCFLLDDSEAAFDGVVGSSCTFLSISRR